MDIEYIRHESRKFARQCFEQSTEKGSIYTKFFYDPATLAKEFGFDDVKLFRICYEYLRAKGIIEDHEESEEWGNPESKAGIYFALTSLAVSFLEEEDG